MLSSLPKWEVLGANRNHRHRTNGATSGARLAQGGHTVLLGSRQPQAKTDILNQVPCATITSNETALRVSEIVVIALRFIAVKSFAEQHADLLRNARVLDGMAPLIVELTRDYGNGEHRLSWKLLG